MESKTSGVGQIHSAQAALVEWVSTHGGKARDEVVKQWLVMWLGADSGRLPSVSKEIMHHLSVCAIEAAVIEGRVTERAGAPRLMDAAMHALRAGLDRSQQRFLEAMGCTPMRLYQVSRTNPGKSFVVVDLMASDEPMLTVMDSTLSEKLKGGDVLGMRVVDMATHKVSCRGLFPINPANLSTVLATLNEIDRDKGFRDPRVSLAPVLGHMWCAQVIGNTRPKIFDEASGEELVLINDYYAIEDWSTLSARMNARHEYKREGSMSWSWLVKKAVDTGEGGGLSAGVQLPDGLALGASIYRDRQSGMLCVFCQSDRMAVEHRQMFEAVAGGAVRHVRKERKTVQEGLEEMEQHPQRFESQHKEVMEAVGGEGMTRLVQEMYEQQYGKFADTPLPALNGKTPRQACTTSAGQERVRALIRMYESNEQRLAANDKRKPVSLKWLWEQVGIKPG